MKDKNQLFVHPICRLSNTNNNNNNTEINQTTRKFSSVMTGVAKSSSSSAAGRRTRLPPTDRSSHGINGGIDTSAKGLVRKVAFMAPGVAAKVGEDTDEVLFVGGSVSIVEKPHGIFIDWSPSDNPDDAGNEWVLTPNTPISFNNKSSTENVDVGRQRRKNFAEEMKKFGYSVDIKNLQSFQCYESRPKTHKGAFSPWIRLIEKDGSTYLPLYFRHGGVTDFIEYLKIYATLKRSMKDPNLITFMDEKAEALEQSVNLLFNKEGQHPSYLSKIVSNPYATALTGLGKVTNFLNDHVAPALMDENHGVTLEEHQEQINSLIQLDKDEADANNLRLHSSEGYELVTPLTLPDRPAICRDKPLNELQWETAFDPKTGLITDVRELNLTIFRGGVAPGLRSEVWKYQLGYYKWNWTREENEKWRLKRTDDYFRMKLQWKSINEEQADRFTMFAERKGLIEKDVARTDRNHKFFEGSNNSHCDMLNDILMTYVMYNFDLGYVQGMSDLLSPILVVMENEVDAFWSFAGFMDKVHGNFAMDQASIRKQLMELRDLVMLVNPTLSNYLETHNSDNMYFTFRWLLVWFKREFSFTDIMKLWECLWTELPCRNFHLLLCVAILDNHQKTITQSEFGFTEILKYVNELSTKIALDETLTTAEGIFHQLAAVQDKLVDSICKIIGFHPYNTSPAKKQLLDPSPPTSSSALSKDTVVTGAESTSTPGEDHEPRSLHCSNPPTQKTVSHAAKPQSLSSSNSSTSGPQSNNQSISAAAKKS